MTALRFDIAATHGEARAGVLTVGGTTILTPVFMPVGTQATVKGLTPSEVADTGARIVLGNTYHLWLRPGADHVQRLGGLHAFMAWPHALLTDSGGYQIFSLAKLGKVTDEGATFQSHLDGSRHLLTPEVAMEVQAKLGSDIAMVLDQCPPHPASDALLRESMRRTTAWAKRSLAVAAPPGQARFVIAQGGVSPELRHEHVAELADLAADGMALGGLSVGEPPALMYEVLEHAGPRMPAAKPRYLMGVGTPVDLVQAVAFGIDMFDCVMPTRNARNGQAFTWQGALNLRNAAYRDDQGPLDDACRCAACRTFTRAYLRHLFMAKEMLGPRLLTQHNLHFYSDLIQAARDAICGQQYPQFRRTVLNAYASRPPEAS